MSNQHAFPRARRAAVKSRSLAVERGKLGPARKRRGQAGAAKKSWRRCSTGTNHISAFGVWRDRARRSGSRINRCGDTRWHQMPSASCAVRQGLACND
jgi:hypothetical protein